MSNTGYDAAGNVMGDGLNMYTYDDENRPITVNPMSGGADTFEYDAEGKRVRRTINGSAPVEYVYDNQGRHIGDMTAAGLPTLAEVYAGPRHLATYANGNIYFIHSDWLGTERARSQWNGNPLETCASLPYGDGLTCTGTDVSPMHFTGKERDTESGNDYFGARYYASNMGRFMSPDWSDTPSPIPYADLPNPQSLNLYSYVKNNPLSRTDADGHCDVDGEHHGGLWCFAHALGITETAKETQTRLANEASGFIAANNIGLIYVNGQWQQPSSASNAQLVDWWDAYNQDNQDNIAHGGRGLAFAGAAAGALTTPQARDLAKYLGFRPVNVDWDTHGQTVFEKNGRYISLDKDSHSGGVWKEFDRQGNRTGTLDAFLNKIGK